MLTALVVPVPEAAPLVDGWREQTATAKPSAGMPPHVTLLFPFVPAEQVDDALLADLRALLGGFEPFDVTFVGTARFATFAYLAPEPAAPFAALIAAVAERFPDYPQYDGEHGDVVPHLTIARGEPALLDAAEADVLPKLPLSARVTEAHLFEELEALSQRWGSRARFPLDGPR